MQLLRAVTPFGMEAPSPLLAMEGEDDAPTMDEDSQQTGQAQLVRSRARPNPHSLAMHTFVNCVFATVSHRSAYTTLLFDAQCVPHSSQLVESIVRQWKMEGVAEQGLLLTQLKHLAVCVGTSKWGNLTKAYHPAWTSIIRLAVEKYTFLFPETTEAFAVVKSLWNPDVANRITYHRPRPEDVQEGNHLYLFRCEIEDNWPYWHQVALLKIGNLWVKCNRGVGSEPFSMPVTGKGKCLGLEFIVPTSVPACAAVKASVCRDLMSRSWVSGALEAHPFLQRFKEFGTGIPETRRVFGLPQAKQKVSNCAWASPEEAIFAAILVPMLQKAGFDLTAEDAFVNEGRVNFLNIWCRNHDGVVMGAFIKEASDLFRGFRVFVEILTLESTLGYYQRVAKGLAPHVDTMVREEIDEASALIMKRIENLPDGPHKSFYQSELERILD